MISGALEFMNEWDIAPNTPQNSMDFQVIPLFDRLSPNHNHNNNDTSNHNKPKNHNNAANIAATTSGTHATSIQSSTIDNVIITKDSHHNNKGDSVDEDEFSSSDDGSHGIENNKYYKEMLERERIMNEKDEQDKRRVNCSRILVSVMLCTVAFILGHLVYFYIKFSERDTCFEKFDTKSEEFINLLHLQRDIISDSMYKFSLLYESSSAGDERYKTDYNVSSHFYTLDKFEPFAQNVRETTGIQWLVYTPYLTTKDMVDQWEAYAASNQDWMTLRAEKEIDDAEGHLQESTAATQKSMSPPPIVDSVWQYDNSNGDIVPITATAAMNQGVCPLWQMSPPPPPPPPLMDPSTTSAINFNLLTDPAFQYAMHRTASTMETPKAIWSPPVSNEWNVSSPFIVPPSPTSRDDDLMIVPHSWIVYPLIGDQIEESSSANVVGALVSMISWEALLANSLDTAMDGMLIVTEHCGVKSSFLVAGSNKVQYLGSSSDEYYDPKFDNMAMTFVLSEVSDVDTEFDRWTINCQGNADILVHVYPTKSLQDACYSGDAAKYTILISVLFSTSVILFIIYDYNVKRRQAKVEGMAKQTDAIVQQIFPGQLREMVIEEDNGSFASEHDEEATNHTKKQTNTIDDNAKQMADFYPEATVAMIDLLGFTAWSSTREPSQVFDLLEHIFQGFDKVARHRGIFKVETVSDKYVAVAGVPYARTDHAVAMARFARNCVQEFGKTLHELERKFGPDTAEMGLRIGLHSGAITAGVLRGDRARFQLFGDTVNTTTQVLEKGIEKNQILLSQQTADLLTNSDKEHWLRQVADSGETVNLFSLHIRPARRRSVTFSERSLGTETSFISAEGGGIDLMDDGDQVNIDGVPPLDELKTKLVEWNCAQLERLLRKIMSNRQIVQKKRTALENLHQVAQAIGRDSIPAEEVKEVIELPEFNSELTQARDIDSVDLDDDVLIQLRKYISRIASMYQDNPFHNFQHASHVAMSMMKLLNRIVSAPHAALPKDVEKQECAASNADALLHDNTYGITSDAICQFAVILAALIHDVDHRGVANNVLAKEQPELGAMYKHKSVAEQNSVDLAWQVLMEDEFLDLRDCIFTDLNELHRFRALLVNSVIATDIFDKEQGAIRKNRWTKAFDTDRSDAETAEDVNRKATIVIEHLIQASDVAHTMQHWDVYQTWNERLFLELRAAYRTGRIDTCPSEGWYKGEIWFFDNYIIPLAKKLDTCGVFGVSTDEFLSYATVNRRNWLERGEGIVAKWLEKGKDWSDSTSK